MGQGRLGAGARLVGAGILLGVPGLFAVSGVLRGVPVGISPGDPLTLGAVALTRPRLSFIPAAQQRPKKTAGFCATTNEGELPSCSPPPVRFS